MNTTTNVLEGGGACLVLSVTFSRLFPKSLDGSKGLHRWLRAKLFVAGLHAIVPDVLVVKCKK